MTGCSHQPEGCAEDDGAGALGADDGACEVEAVLVKKLVQIESGDAAWDAGKFDADLLGVSVANGFEGGVDFGDAAAGGDVGGEFGFSGGADG